jgi:hypothetical protein
MMMMMITTTLKMKDKWEGKRMHGNFPCSLDEKLVDKHQLH